MLMQPSFGFVKLCDTEANVPPPVSVRESLVVCVPPLKVSALPKLPSDRSTVSESLPASVLTVICEPDTDANGTSIVLVPDPVAPEIPVVPNT